MPRNRASGETWLRVISPASVMQPTAKISLSTMATGGELSGLIHDLNISGVLLLNHRSRIGGSFR
jgi:hypothetical protein